jgi:2-polyprenyl-3-methyl-5-hydroxy-6-metoxy-1,4-benzoquinol methylase
MIMQFIKRLKSKLSFSSSLEDGGERVDLILTTDPEAQKLDMYQKSHLFRYNYAVSIIEPGSVVGDFACGTGYGSMLLAKKAQHVLGIDIDETVIKSIQKRYATTQNVEFLSANLLDLKYENELDILVSFETIEHFTELDILRLLQIFHRGLKPNGRLVFSTPYLQEASATALQMGFHKTFEINEVRIKNWLQKSNFDLVKFHYQDYQSHHVVEHLDKPDFIICEARKK